MDFRDYNPDKDKDAVHRIWDEVGWLEDGDAKPMDTLIEANPTIVADINGEPECLVVSSPGDMDYLGERLKFSCIAGVTTSLIARRQKLAGRLTAARIALDAADGAIVSGLGMFEQGFYDLLGFGTNRYHHHSCFAPSTLKVDVTPRVPKRLTKKDGELIHESRLKRLRGHGSVSLDPVANSTAEMNWVKSGCGFGYCNDDGELTHHFWMHGKGKEHGPFHIWWQSYQNYDQFLELLALLKSFGEQIHLVTISDPPGIQIQDFIDKPIQRRIITKKSKYQAEVRAMAWIQTRILDLTACLAQTHLPGETIRFNLKLLDPIERYLEESFNWRGIGGDYVVTLGPESKAKSGSEKSLPTMSASVNAFTRLWLGVRDASVLRASDGVQAPDELCGQLDRLIRLPDPQPDWPF